ncbi:hypothetical protein HMPREF1981_03202 [Bacteroides pyogenes F0041]|uniref:Uncharacterized protein n=1 Tax=Bacteroides pyogenes F0041 TaxID=1321819 RepID=U2CBP4_9BACE|nr:hypothetical protein HMPREF1981_03202 [Bacteroides pyogenes F0041]
MRDLAAEKREFFPLFKCFFIGFQIIAFFFVGITCVKNLSLFG